MGTTAHVMIGGGYRGALDRAERRLIDLEHRWSRFRPDSELSQLNDSAGRPVMVSAETYRLIAASIEAWHQTDQRFDPTIGVTMTAAGYDRSFEQLTGSCRASAVRHVPAPGPAEIVLHPYAGAVELPVGVRLDLGGIAKGAAADLVAEELIQDGVDGCCVNIGGDLRAMGRPPRVEGWQVTLDCPGGDRSVPIGLAAGAVCTTTKLRRRWATTSGSEHHLRDPASGSAWETGIASVSVIGARAMQAEVLAKAIFAAGVPAAAAIAERFAVSGVVIADDGTVVPMPGLQPFVDAALAPASA